MSCSAGQGPRMPGKIHRRKMLFGEMGFPDQVPKTRSTGAERFTRPRQLTSNSSALGDSGSDRMPASVFGVPKDPSYTASCTVR